MNIINRINSRYRAVTDRREQKQFWKAARQFRYHVAFGDRINKRLDQVLGPNRPNANRMPLF